MMDYGVSRAYKSKSNSPALLTGVRCHQEMWKNSWKRLHPIQRVHQSSASLDRRPLRCILRTEYTYPIMETFQYEVLSLFVTCNNCMQCLTIPSPFSRSPSSILTVTPNAN